MERGGSVCEAVVSSRLTPSDAVKDSKKPLFPPSSAPPPSSPEKNSPMFSVLPTNLETACFQGNSESRRYVMMTQQRCRSREQLHT